MALNLSNKNINDKKLDDDGDGLVVVAPIPASASKTQNRTDKNTRSKKNQSYYKNVNQISNTNTMPSSSQLKKIIFKSRRSIKKNRYLSDLNDIITEPIVSINSSNNTMNLSFSSVTNLLLATTSNVLLTKTSDLVNHSETNSNNSKTYEELDYNNNNNKESEYYVDRGVFSTRDLVYKPETGLRTASVLGFMLFLIVFYLIWRNRCRCGNDSDSSDYDMEYWLNYVDEQKLVRKHRETYVHNPQLPVAKQDSKQSTAAWVIEHRKIWQNTQKKRDKEKSKLECSDEKSTKYNYLLKSRLKQSLQNPVANINEGRASLLNSFLTPFRRRIRSLNLRKSGQKSNNKTKLFQELDAKTQLLINYARIDAITNVRFNKFSQNPNPSVPQTFTSSYLLGQNIGPSTYLLKQQQKKKMLLEHEHFTAYKTILSSTLSNPLLDLNIVIDSLVLQDSLENSKNILNKKKSFAVADGNTKEDAERDENQQISVDEFKEISQTQIIQKLLLNMLLSNRRRSQSWPRSKRDQLQLNNFNREIRLVYYQNQKKHLVKKETKISLSSVNRKKIDRKINTNYYNKNSQFSPNSKSNDNINYRPTTSKAAAFQEPVLI